MAVDGGTVGQAIGAGESSRALPLGEGFVNGGVGWMLANTALNAMVGGVRAVAAVGRLAGLRGGERVAFAHVLHRAQSISIQLYYNIVISGCKEKNGVIIHFKGALRHDWK